MAQPTGAYKDFLEKQKASGLLQPVVNQNTSGVQPTGAYKDFLNKQGKVKQVATQSTQKKPKSNFMEGIGKLGGGLTQSLSVPVNALAGMKTGELKYVQGKMKNGQAPSAVDWATQAFPVAGPMVRSLFDPKYRATVTGQMRNFVGNNIGFEGYIKQFGEGSKEIGETTPLEKKAGELARNEGVQSIGGLGLNIGLDPTNIINPAGIVKQAKNINKVSQIGRVADTAITESKAINKVRKAFDFAYGNPESYQNAYQKILTESDDLVKQLENIVTQGAFQGKKKLGLVPVARSAEDQKKMALYLTGAIGKDELPKELLDIATEAKKFHKDDVTKLFQMGADKYGLDLDTYKKTMDTYLKEMYRGHLDEKGIKSLFATSKSNRVVKDKNKKTLLDWAYGSDMGEDMKASAIDVKKLLSNIKNPVGISKIKGIGEDSITSARLRSNGVRLAEDLLEKSDEELVRLLYPGKKNKDIVEGAKIGMEGLVKSESDKLASQFDKVGKLKEQAKTLLLERVKEEGLIDNTLSEAEMVWLKGKQVLMNKADKLKFEDYGAKVKKIYGDENGFIEEFAPRFFAGESQNIKNIKSTRVLNLADQYSIDPDEFAKMAESGKVFGLNPQEFVQVDNKSLKTLDGKFLPSKIYDDVEMLNAGLNGLEKTSGKFLKYWKPMKTIFSPPAILRNVQSNFILAHMSGVNLADPVYIKSFVNANKAKRADMLGKETPKLFRELIEAGFFGKTFGQIDAQELLTDIPGFAKGKKTPEALQAVKAIGRKATDVAGNLYGGIEDINKYAIADYWTKKGFSTAEAMKKAEEALFNYGKLTKTEQKYFKQVLPFYTFTRKVIPLVLKTVYERPARLSLFNKIEQAIEWPTKDEADERFMPDYMKDMIRTPIKDKKGNPLYFNPQYIYPWNAPEGIVGAGGVSGMNPLFKEPIEQMLNLDFFSGRKIADPTLAPGMKMGQQGGERVKHLARTMLPNLTPAPYPTAEGGARMLGRDADRILSALTNRTFEGQDVTTPQALVHSLLGVRTYESDPQKNLQNAKYMISDIKRTYTKRIKDIQKSKNMSAERKKKETDKLIQERQRAIDLLLEGKTAVK